MFAFSILGLPAHPLIVHGAVVGIPTAALAMMVYAARPSWRRPAWWLFVGVVVFSWVFSILAGSTGESLEHALPESSLIEEHAEWAEALGAAVHVFAASALVWLVGDRLRWRRTEADPLPGPAIVLHRLAMPVAILAAVACLGLVGVVGHLGAKAAWHDSPAATK